MVDRLTPSLLLVGGGLQNSLIALAVLEARPDARVVLFERDVRPCGNHTWCFHETDVPVPLRRLVAGLATHRWDSYDVRFPDRSRHVEIGYACLTSDGLADTLL